jgi:hypothetical protein
MDQAAVQTSVAALERMDLNEAEGSRGRLEHRIEFSLAHALVRRDQPLHHGRKILRARADEFRQRITFVIALAKEDAVRPQARLREAHVRDQHGVQPQDLIERQLVLSGLHYRPPPTLKAATWRPLTFDLEACTVVCEQKEARRERDDIGAGVADDLIRLLAERARAP